MMIESLIKLNGLYINNTFGLQVDERVSIGINAEIDFYARQRLKFSPIFLSTRYNLIINDANYFVRGGIGRLIKLGKDYEKGTFYKLGLGIQFFDEKKIPNWLAVILVEKDLALTNKKNYPVFPFL